MKTLRSGSSLLVIGVAIWTTACAPAGQLPLTAPPAPSPPTPTRPVFELATDERYDFAGIAPYRANHASVYAHIDEHLPQHIHHLQRWVRQRSISPQRDGIEEMAALVQEDLRSIGFHEAELVRTEGHPGVWGYYDAGATRTLLVYMMYDVQPVNEQEWQTDPFAGNLVDHELGQVLMARGATNQKGPQRAFLNAVDSIIRITGTLPVNLIITAEGEEELGSPHYPQFVSQYEERLRQAHGVYFPMNGQLPDGKIAMYLGVKGIIYFELEAVGGKWGGPQRHAIHGSFKSLVDAPVWRLIHALASLTTEDGNTIAIDGYYDTIIPPTREEQQLINSMSTEWNEAQLQQLLGVDHWIDGATGTTAILGHLYGATLNIDGIWGGYTGPGSKTVLPHMATAKVDSRLPPGLQPEQAISMIRQHLDAHGFSDITLRKLDDGYPAAQTSITEPWVQSAIGVFKKTGYPLQVQPRIGGSAPFYQFTDRLGLPLVFTALGHGSGAHGPDEYMLITPKPGVPVAGLAAIEKAYVDLIYSFAATP